MSWRLLGSAAILVGLVLLQVGAPAPSVLLGVVLAVAGIWLRARLQERARRRAVQA